MTSSSASTNGAIAVDKKPNSARVAATELLRISACTRGSTPLAGTTEWVARVERSRFSASVIRHRIVGNGLADGQPTVQGVHASFDRTWSPSETIACKIPNRVVELQVGMFLRLLPVVLPRDLVARTTGGPGRRPPRRLRSKGAVARRLRLYADQARPLLWHQTDRGSSGSRTVLLADFPMMI